jgi:hypothetical protein
VTCWEKIRGGSEDREREWMRKGRKSNWEKEQWIIVQEKRKSEEGKNRDKKIMMVKLIIQKKRKKKHQVPQHLKVHSV